MKEKFIPEGSGNPVSAWAWDWLAAAQAMLMKGGSVRESLTGVRMKVEGE